MASSHGSPSTTSTASTANPHYMAEVTFQPQLPKRGYGARLRSLVSSSGYGQQRPTSPSHNATQLL